MIVVWGRAGLFHGERRRVGSREAGDGRVNTRAFAGRLRGGGGRVRLVGHRDERRIKGAS